MVFLLSEFIIEAFFNRAWTNCCRASLELMSKTHLVGGFVASPSGCSLF